MATSNPERSPGAGQPSLQQFYHDYLSAINARNWPLVSTFAAPSTTHNGNTRTNTEYASMIDKTSSVFPGIIFVPERLLCDEQKCEIACRIRFDFEDGRDSFYEHVFYRLEGGKIAEVWSMVDFPKA